MIPLVTQIGPHHRGCAFDFGGRAFEMHVGPAAFLEAIGLFHPRVGWVSGGEGGACQGECDAFLAGRGTEAFKTLLWGILGSGVDSPLKFIE